MFRGIEHAFRQIERHVFHAQQVHGFKQHLAGMGERDRRVVGESLLQEDVSIKPTHLPDREDTYASKRFRIDVQNFSFSDVSLQLCTWSGLKAENRHFPGGSVLQACRG
jgi:hypothetical protein